LSVKKHTVVGGKTQFSGKDHPNDSIDAQLSNRRERLVWERKYVKKTKGVPPIWKGAIFQMHKKKLYLKSKKKFRERKGR